MAVILPDSLRQAWRSLRTRMIVGALLLTALAAALAGLGVWSIDRIRHETERRMAELGQVTRTASAYESLVFTQNALALRYLLAPDPQVAQQFAELGLRAHETRLRFADLPGLTEEDLAASEQIDGLHSRLEVEYALAHAERDLGDLAAAQRRLAQIRPLADSLRMAIARFAAAQTAKVEQQAAHLTRYARREQGLLLMLGTVLLGVVVVLMATTVRHATGPLTALVSTAERLGAGDLRARVGGDGRLLQEYATLAHAFDTMAERLRGIVAEAVGMAEQLSHSAGDLSSISEEVTASSSEVASAMVEITRGAEAQSAGLRRASEALEAMGAETGEIDRAAQSVNLLMEQIQATARKSREEVAAALGLLLEIRTVVERSGTQVEQLAESSRKVDRFVETIAGIARQTNLLALNAAIEAARAGEHGRGFAVVAEEVRKLAEASARAAQEVAQTVAEIRARLDEVVGTMDQGQRQVGRVEAVSRQADTALEQIIAAVDGVRMASERVVEAVGRNREALVQVERVVQEIAATAESHAASAQQVSAAAEEQSAATEEMSAASSQLLQSAERLRELVQGFRV